MGIETDRYLIDRQPDFNAFQKMLNEHGINYRFMGSVAIESYCQIGSKNSKQNTDLDLLVSRQDYLKLKSPTLNNQLNANGKVRYDSSISKYIDFRPNEEFSFLIFRETRMPVKSVLFEPRQNLLFGQKIETVPAITLFHTFSVCGGVLRPKDWGKILHLGKYVRNNPDNKFSENDFVDFHKFLDIRSQLYSHDIWLLGRLQILLSYSPNFFQDVALRIRKRLAKNYLGSSKNWEQKNH